MKHGNVSLKRLLAMILAVVMVTTNLSGLTLPVGAAGDDEVTVSIGELVAENYDLTDAEKELLKSGYLVCDDFTYVAPTNSDDLITVDTENAKITAKTHKGWKPVKATIVYGNKEMTVTLTDGVGTYDADVVGNTFSVKVDYELVISAEGYNIQQLLDAAGYLKQGIANLDVVSGQSGNLYILEQAMPSLIELANMVIQIGTSGMTAGLSDEGKAAIHALNDQMTANGGQLTLSTMIAEYDAGYKTEYLVKKGAAMQTALEELLANLVIIEEALTTLANNVEVFIQYGLVEAALGEQLKTLSGIVTNLTGALTDVSEEPWTVANLGTELVKANANFQKLDNLVANLGTVSSLTAKSTLKVATVTLQYNMSMFDVTVKVALQVVGEDNAIVTFDTKQVVLTLAENASAGEILSAVAASGIETSALEAWAGVYEAEHFEVSKSALPNELTEDLTYTITYSPKYYTVSFSYAATQSLPYGYKLELPKHEDPAQAYDYTVNGDRYVQGSVYTVVGNTTISREEGKAYTPGQLLTIIANNYGGEKVAAILKSGALLGDEAVNVRYPDAAESSLLLTLEDGTLSAINYDASYNGLSWVPYSYGVNGNENLFSGNTAPYSGKSAKVVYRLALTNYSDAAVKAWLELAVTLSDEADGQISALDRLSAYTDTMGQLDKTKLGALNGVIDVTDLHSDPVKNEELKTYFKGIVSSIISECLDSDGKLRIYNMLLEYQAEGLIYYYQNSAAFQNELATVSGYLNGMLADQEKIDALTVLVTAAGFPEYAEKIQNVGNALATLEAELTAPNAAIDLNSENLDDLVDALVMDKVATYNGYGTLYLYSDTLTATDASQKMVQLFVNGSAVSSIVFDRGHVLTAQDVAQLQNALSAYIDGLYGANIKYYDGTSNMTLESLIGTELDNNINVRYEYTAKQFTVKIEGEVDQIITIENLKVNLPKSSVSNIIYTYVIDGAEYTTATYTFTAEQLDRLFTDGTYTITRVATDMGAAKLQQIVNDLNNKLGAGSVVLVTDANGEYIGMKINVEAAEMMDFIMGLTAYSYIGMNNEGLMYLMQDANGNYMTEICMQTIINALLSDETFSSETLIALGENGGGKLMNTTLQLGNDADDLIYDLDLVINLASVPSQMSTVASALKSMRSYLKFYANDGAMEFELNLPDQVYGAYLVALVATGNVDKSDANAIEQQIAFQFLCDYLDAVLDSGADMTTLQNTLEMLGVNLSVEQYQNYFDAFINAREDEMFTYVTDENGLNLEMSIPGPAAISRVLSLIGFGGDMLDTYLGMVKENKEGGIIEFAAHATMSEGREYVALVLDVNASGLTNKFACIRADSPAALNEKLSKLAGYATVILLGDVDGNLTISGTTILDLNGKNVSGTITSTGNLFIIDSSMDTYNAGGAYGVSGKVTVVAGNYETNVSAYLKDGYYMDGKTVRNAMYYIESDENGNTTFVVNTDMYKDDNVEGYLPDVRFVAIDMVVDLVLNYATTAGLAVEGNTIYDVAFEDLIGLLESRSGERVIDMLLACVDAAGISATANMFIADLLNFEAIYEGLRTDGVVATHSMTVAPWMVTIERVTEGDYLTLSIRSNAELAKTFSLSLKLEGESANYVKNLAMELAGIVEDETYVEIEIDQPVYDNKELDLGATGNMLISVNMSNNDDYAKMLAVILAYGNPAKAADVAEAINNGNIVGLKYIVDNTTVAELFTALKVMSRNVTFAQMAETVGITVDVTSAAKLESVYHLILVAAGKVLEELDITGMNSKFGNLYDETTGYYVLDKFDMFREGELNARGYSARYELEVGEIIFRVKLFGEHEHVFGEWIVEVEPTCTEPGKKVRVCACGETEYEEIPALGHSYEAVVTEPTCTEQGYTTYTCSVCGDSYVGDYVDALGHDYEAVVTEPTCTEQGYTTYTCSVCGDSYVADYVDAKGHEFGEWYDETPATCTEDGVARRDCKNCDHYETSKLAAYGHNYEAVVTEPTCTEQGYTTYTCSNCGDTYVADYVDAKGHEFGEWIVQTEPTCTEDGLKSRVCDCGETEYEVIPAHGHNYEAVVTEPTCTEKGYTTYTCSICGDTYVDDYVDALGHNFVDGFCTRCGMADPNNPVTGGLLIGGLVTLMAGATVGGVILYKRRKSEDEEE